MSVSYDDGEVVWVKWNNFWWPGEVWHEARVPKNVKASLHRPVIHFIKFFLEEEFEYVRNLKNLKKYNCDEKLEFIKKGMDKFRSKPKVMENFPIYVKKAEQLTNGDVNILERFETPTKQKAATLVVTSVKTTPVTVAKKDVGLYSASTIVQSTPSSDPKSSKIHKCSMCTYQSDRINLLMMHLKSHSAPYKLSTNYTPEIVLSTATMKTPVKKAAAPIDSIADDVRQIREAIKKSAEPVKKSREPAKATPTGRPRASRKKAALVITEEPAKVEEKPKPSGEVEMIKADWDDDDEVDEKKEAKVDELPKPPPLAEKVGESSKSIRNIPKKQRVSEVYTRQVPVRVVQEKAEPQSPKLETPKSPAKEPKVETPKSPAKEPKAETPKSPIKTPELKSEQKLGATASSDVSVRASKSSKRKADSNERIDAPEPKKAADDDLLMATAELLNETQVPKVENAQLPSTFHNSNDIDQRNLPPKERNKRICRDQMSRESPTDKNGSTIAITSPTQNEEKLPYKKKQSSRLPIDDKTSPDRESRSIRETRQETPATEQRNRKKRKSIGESSPMEVDTNSHETSMESKIPNVIQSPLREEPAADDAVSTTTKSHSPSRRGQKRRLSVQTLDAETCSEPKKVFKSDSEMQPRMIVASASETICITSSGSLSVTSKDTVVTTEANTIVVTSQVIITEATQRPIVSVASAHSPPKSHFTSNVKITTPSPKNALKFPPEELDEMKKQGLVMVGADKKNKFTEKGKQYYLNNRNPDNAADIVLKRAEEKKVEPEQMKSPEMPETAVQSMEQVSPADIVMEPEEKIAEEVIVAEEPEVEQVPVPVNESNGTPAHETLDESTNNNDTEKEPVVVSPSKEADDEAAVGSETAENGSTEVETEVPVEDPDNGGSGLIALQAENFGGPPNCFYLCRQMDDRYEPVDNQILVLNAQNALVPYVEGDIVAEDLIAQTEVAIENLAGYPQHSPNSNIIINTPSGQKIELNHMMIIALQEQADENGIASIEMAGEQLELNIGGILEAISAQQEANEREALLPPGALLIDGDIPLILDTSDLPVEVHHSATQVSETLTKPIMSTTIAPEISSKATISEVVSKNLNIEDSLASIGVTTNSSRSNVPKSLELPITITNPTIAETVNHRKLILEVTSVEPDSFVVQSRDNGSQE